MVELEAQLAMAEAKHLPKAETQRGRKPTQQNKGRAGGPQSSARVQAQSKQDAVQKLTKVWERLVRQQFSHARQILVSSAAVLLTLT